MTRRQFLMAAPMVVAVMHVLATPVFRTKLRRKLPPRWITYAEAQVRYGRLPTPTTRQQRDFYMRAEA